MDKMVNSSETENFQEVEELTEFTPEYEEKDINEKKDGKVHKAGRAKKAKSRLGTYEHDLRININRMVKECEENDIPIFIAYFGEHEGWVYNAILPEETSHTEEYGKFNKFLAIVIDWDKEEELAQIKVRNDWRWLHKNARI